MGTFYGCCLKKTKHEWAEFLRTYSQRKKSAEAVNDLLTGAV